MLCGSVRTVFLFAIYGAWAGLKTGAHTKATGNGRRGNIGWFLQYVYCFRIAYYPFRSLSQASSHCLLLFIIKPFSSFRGLDSWLDKSSLVRMSLWTLGNSEDIFTLFRILTNQNVNHFMEIIIDWLIHNENNNSCSPPQSCRILQVGCFHINSWVRKM